MGIFNHKKKEPLSAITSPSSSLPAGAADPPTLAGDIKRGEVANSQLSTTVQAQSQSKLRKLPGKDSHVLALQKIAGSADIASSKGHYRQHSVLIDTTSTLADSSGLQHPTTHTTAEGYVIVSHPPSSGKEPTANGHAPDASTDSQPSNSPSSPKPETASYDSTPGLIPDDTSSVSTALITSAPSVSTSSSSGSPQSHTPNSGLKGKPVSRPKGPPALMIKRLAIEPEWRDRLPLVMQPLKADGSNTPAAVIKDLSNASSIGLTADAKEIEIQAQEWQELKEAEALLRLTFRDYDGTSVWWYYTIPSFVSTIITGTTETDVPEFSNPTLGLKCSIAPYDENSTRRAFFLTCPEWEPLNQAYNRIKRAWNFWRYISVEKQIDAALGVVHKVTIVRIKADGNCLFRAFAKAILGDEERHMEVRKALVDFMMHSEELRSFIVSDNENDDSAAFADNYLNQMSKAGTWGDQVEIAAFTHVYKRSVRTFSYNYVESRLISVLTPLNENSLPMGSEVWLLHIHGHYSVLGPGVAPIEPEWAEFLREIDEAKRPPSTPLNHRQQLLDQQRTPPKTVQDRAVLDRQRDSGLHVGIIEGHKVNIAAGDREHR